MAGVGCKPLLRVGAADDRIQFRARAGSASFLVPGRGQNSGFAAVRLPLLVRLGWDKAVYWTFLPSLTLLHPISFFVELVQYSFSDCAFDHLSLELLPRKPWAREALSCPTDKRGSIAAILSNIPS